MIRLMGVSKSFPGVKSLNNVDFSAVAGEIHALVGENGAGKSTLSKIIGGVFPPDAGEIRLEGRPVRWGNPREAQSAGIHVIYQELVSFSYLTVAENVFVRNQPLTRLGLVDHAAMEQRAEQALRRLGAQFDVRRKVGSLSVAERQMVEIAKALIGDLKVLILDEPTGVIAGREVDHLFNQLAVLKAAGVAIIYISHRLDEIFRIASRVTVLKDGHLVGVREIRDIDRDQLIRLMVGRVLADIYPPRRPPPKGAKEVLRAENISLGRRVRGVSFALRAGEVVGLGGMVGSGRTELAMAVFGGLKRDSGEVFVEGRLLPPASPRSSIEAGVGLLTEDRKGEGLLTNLSIAENITAPCLSEIMSGLLLDLAAERKIGQEEIRKFAIAAPVPETQVNTLSGGNQQKTLFARWTRACRRVLLLDEPTRGVDIGSKAEIYKIIRTLAENGLAILMISSEMPELVGMCDRVLVMREGEIAGELVGSDISEESMMALAVRQESDAFSGACLESAAQ
jgi:ABC-type sugar transport system ATPase subunit